MKYSSSNKPMQCMMTQSTCYRGTGKMNVVGVLWHCTGANNPWLKRYVQPDDNASDRAALLAKLGTNAYKNDWNHTSVQAGLNCWIGKLADGTVTTVQTMPWDYRPWGCGSGSKGSCNNGWIQFEMCEDALTDATYFNAVYKEACELTAYLCKMYNIDPKGSVTLNGVKVPTILCHQDSYKLGLGSNHGDVYNWFNKHGKTMDNVRADVSALLGSSGSSGGNTGTTSGGTTTSFKSGDVVKITGTTYYNGKSVPGWVLAKKWIVYSASGDRVVINKSEDGVNAIMSPFKASDLALASAAQTTTPVTVTGTVSTGSDADKKNFHDFFMDKFNNEFGVAGLWGNIYAESGGRSNNLQNTYETKLGYTDASYTTAVDNGSYTNFVKDSAGYGLAQWTFETRKQALLDYAKAAKKSIGDYATQLAFLYKELSEGYAAVLKTLKNAKTVKEASDAVLTQFERPADTSDAVKTKRAGYGQEFYNKFATSDSTVVTEKPADSGCYASEVIAVAQGELGYYEKASNANLDDKTANKGSANYTKYARDFDSKYPNWYNGKKNGYAWCDMFVDWCFLTAFGYEKALYLLCQPEKSAGAGCTYSLRYYKAKGQFYTSNPKAGDQIFFGTSVDNSTHTGLVEKVDGGKVYTIEGNTSDMVARRTYTIGASNIVGYGRPNYDGAGNIVTTEPPTGGSTHSVLRKGSTGSEVEELQRKLTSLGYALGSVDGDFGEKTLAAVKAFQKDYSLDVDGVVGNQTWTALDKAVAAKSSTTSYMVKVTTEALNIRAGAGTNYNIVGCIRDKGVYTIVEEKAGWGRLKSGVGWICLEFTKKV